MQFRIGINLGDVIEEEERIYGDGVNIAARLETLADPGGICVSKAAFDHIESKLPLGYEYLGEQTVKNIAKPVGAYRVMMEPRVTMKKEAKEGERPKVQGVRRNAIVLGALGAIVVLAIAAGVWQFALRPSPSRIEKASKERMALPLPDKPSIAVMPFLNMTGDQGQEVFCDGLSEGLITALSKLPQLFVIGRDSTFSYKGKVVKAGQVSEELGVQYVLEGSVQKAGDRVRVTAQLIDALKGHHLWADRYDRELKDLFHIQDDITKHIVTALNVKLTHGDLARVWARGTENLDAYLKALEAGWLTGQSTREGLERARRLAEEAVALDSKFPTAYYILGAVHMVEALTGFSKNPRESLELANKMQQKAIELDGSFAMARALLGYNLAMLRRHDEAIAEAERAYELAPNSVHVLYWYGTILSYVGRAGEGVSFLEEALRLDPKPPNSRLRSLGLALRESGRYEEAIGIYRRAVQREPDDILAQIGLAATYSLAGREEEARTAAKEVLRINPRFSLDRYMRTLPLKDPTARERFAEALRKAGLPD